jgi:hypothetical protein
MTPRHQLLAEIARTPSPTRAENQNRSRWAAISSVAVAVLIFEVVGGLENSAGRPMTYTLGLAAGWALFAATLSAFVLWRRTTLGRAPRWLLAAALVSPVVLLGWMHLFDGAYVEPFSRLGFRCMAYTFAMAALPLGSFMVLRRGFQPRGAWQLGAALGAITGAWAGVLVELWCPLVNLPHAMVGHVLPLIALIAAGALWGRRALDITANA